MARARSDSRRGLSRDEIFAAAVTAFSRNGYRGTNLQDVASVLGVTRQAIYYHYRNKHALLFEMFQTFFDELDGAVEEASAATDDPIKRFEGMLRGHVLTVAQTTPTSAIFTRDFESLQPEAQEAVRDRRRGYQRRFVDALEAAQAAGGARDIPASAAVSLMFGAANWTFRWYQPERSGLTPEQLADLTVDLFRSGYRSR